MADEENIRAVIDEGRDSMEKALERFEPLPRADLAQLLPVVGSRKVLASGSGHAVVLDEDDLARKG